MKTIYWSLFFILLPLFSFSQNSLFDSLIVYYPMNGNFIDSSGNNFDATPQNGVVGATDRFGNPNGAVYFDGIDDIVSLPNIAALKPSLPVTMSFWVKTVSLDLADNYWFHTEETYNYWTGFKSHTSADNSGKVSVSFSDGGTQTTSSRRTKVSSATLTVNTWQHIVLIIRGANDIDIYIDCNNAGGTYSGSGSTSVAYNGNAGNFGYTSGNSLNSPDYFNGWMDEFAFWNRALDPSEIVELCANGIDCSTSSQQNLSICAGDSVVLSGDYQTTAGIYNDTLQNSNGCDSIVTTTLTINSDSINQSVSICQGDSAFLEGSYQMTSGVYIDVLTSQVTGCDSVISTTLNILNPTSSNQSISICNGDSIFVGGAVQFSTGSYLDTYVGSNGCDSIVTTNLTVINSALGAFNGVVYFNGAPISSGVVRLINKTGNSPQTMIDIDSTLVDGFGAFSFSNIPVGDYLIKALGDTSLYDNVATYGDSTNHWQWGTLYNVSGNCADSMILADIYLIDFPTTIGFGNINGSITQGGKKMNGLFTGKGITLENTVDGAAVQGSFIDSLDKFSFSQIENGSYRIYLDLEGYTNDTLSIITFDPSITDYNITLNVNDSTSHISVFSVTETTGIQDLNNDFPVSIYPNPFKNSFELKLVSIVENIDIALYDISGKLINVSNYKNVSNIVFDLNEQESGVYYLTLRKGSLFKTIKAIKE